MLYKNENGSHSDVPWGRERALTDGAPRYMRSATDAFERCGDPIVISGGGTAPCACMARYTETGECVDCTAQKLWLEALSLPDVYPTTPEGAEKKGLDYVISPAPCREGPHLRTYRINGDGESCTTCSDAPGPRDAAGSKHLPTYIPKSKCKLCKTKSPRHTDTGRCLKCEKEKAPVELSPRQVARDAGETKYMPYVLCPSCNTQSLKAVHDGACDGCKAKVRAQKTVSARVAAKRAGKIKFMPEDPCPRCGLRALKRVHDCACDGCKGKKEDEMCLACDAIAPARCDSCQDKAREARDAKADGRAQRRQGPKVLASRLEDDRYMPVIPCEACGVKAFKHARSGRCEGCEDRASVAGPMSRYAARLEGMTVFIPKDGCLSCGTRSLQSVKDGTCEGCTKVINDARASISTSPQLNEATRTAMTTMPSGQVISMEVAQSCGFDAFRPTGGKWLHIETLKEISA